MMNSVARGFFAVMVLASPLVGDLIGLSIFPIAMAVLVAYDGLTGRRVLGSVAFLVIAEILWGLPTGVWSLAYLGVVGIVRLTEHFITLAPVARERVWSAPLLLRGILVGWAVSLMMIFFSAAIQSLVYHHGSLPALVRAAYQPWGGILTAAVVGVAGGIGILHRITVPFRRRITFGT